MAVIGVEPTYRSYLFCPLKHSVYRFRHTAKSHYRLWNIYFSSMVYMLLDRFCITNSKHATTHNDNIYSIDGGSLLKSSPATRGVTYFKYRPRWQTFQRYRFTQRCTLNSPLPPLRQGMTLRRHHAPKTCQVAISIVNLGTKR